MKSISYQNFFHAYFDDLPLSEEALFGKVFLPEEQHYLVEEAMNCDLIAIRKLKEMFTHGVDGASRNFDVAKRYWYALHSHAEVTCCTSKISFSLDDYAQILDGFDRPLPEIADAYALAISYMTSEVSPIHWDIPVLQKHLTRLDEIKSLLECE
ncbi:MULTISPECIES: hypothetical protein [Phaeodactylibacter]|jgi:hypothetical protein|uniref:Uncharacterized protein n=1 Tax=Phaeodactylibacter luteus TaxID=1564516 RepID=A0A5C6RG08_9BACT|nr:hypothetical protein [Phaeodactylibacter luteus]TXB61358.1 hypothetical protein FRY97_19660 [Phaeodactylibacter luteus]